MLELSEFETQVHQLLAKPTLAPKQLDPALFAEDHDGFGMPKIGSFLKLSNSNLAVVTIGVVMSSTIGGYLSGILGGLAGGISKYSTIIAGLLIMYFGKGKGIVRDLGAGVLIGGLAQLFAGIGQSIMPTSEPMMQEDRVTYGGGDGVYPTQPDRRVFA